MNIFGPVFGINCSKSRQNSCSHRRISLARYVLIGSLGTGCGATLVPSLPQIAPDRHLVDHSNEQGDSRQALAHLAFSGEIAYKPVGNHTNLYTIRSGIQDHVFGHGFALSIKEVTAMGACTKFTVYDFESQTLSWVDGYGYPTCPSPTRTIPEPHVLRVNEAGFRDHLSAVAFFIDEVLKDNRISDDDKKKLKNIYDHLWLKVHSR